MSLGPLDIQLEGVDPLRVFVARATEVVEDIGELQDQIDELLLDEHSEHFRTEGRSQGRTWPRLSPEYARYKGRVRPGRSILVFEGELRESLTEPRGRGHINRRVSPSAMLWGTGVRHARHHQTGTRRMPQRRPVFAGQETADGIAEIWRDRLLEIRDEELGR